MTTTMMVEGIVDDNNDNDDGFQFNGSGSRSKSNNNNNNVRLYLGGLPTTSITIDTGSIKTWLNEHLSNDIEVGVIELNETGKKKSAFVEFSGRGINDVIRQLKQSSNCEYDGCKVTIQREQRKKNNNKRDKKTVVMRRGATGRKNRGGKFNNNGPLLTSKGWSKPTTATTINIAPTEEEEDQWEDSVPVPVEMKSTTIEEVSDQIASVVCIEIEQATDPDEIINSALASTAATTMVASMLSSLSFPQKDDNVNVDNIDSIIDDKNVVVSKTTIATTLSNKYDDFTSFVNNQTDMTELLADFGTADPNWKKKIVEKDNDYCNNDDDDDDDDDGNAAAATVANRLDDEEGDGINAV